MLRASGAPRRLGFDRRDGREGSWLAATEHLPPQGVTTPKLVQFLAFADRLGLPAAPLAFGLVPSVEERATADRLLDGLAPPLVVASLGSSCSSRRWFPQPTAAALDALACARGTTTVLTGTTADARFADEVAGRMRTPLCNLVGRTSLRDLVAVLARAAAVFGPDSGALHVAAALGVPVVSLWGATSAARSTPWGQQRGVIEGAAPCAPCFLRDCPIGRMCMRPIEAGAVAARIESMLARA
jgi:ADP-heptose:LPS heptosyltransferase